MSTEKSWGHKGPGSHTLSSFLWWEEREAQEYYGHRALRALTFDLGDIHLGGLSHTALPANTHPHSPAILLLSSSVSGLSPFMGDNDNETLANVTSATWDFDDEAFDEISDDAKDFISNLLKKDMK